MGVGIVKKRHVKCDEEGPPCLNCVVRKTQDLCTYAQPPPPPQQRQQTSNSTPARTPRAHSLDVSPNGPDNGGPPRLSVSPAGDFLKPSPPASFSTSSAVESAAAAAEARQLMDVELMHRLSTVTYKSFVSIAEDRYYLQTQVPLEAFKHEYLLNGILALTALEKALAEGTLIISLPADDEVLGEVHVPLTASGSVTSPERAAGVARTYVRAGLEYYGRAIRAFREKLCGSLGPEDQHPLFFMAMVAPLANLIIPRSLKLLHPERGEAGTDSGDADGSNDIRGSQGHSAIVQACGIFDLLNGMSSIMRMDWGGIINSPAGPSITAALRLGPPDFNSLDSETDEALNRLMVIAASLAPPTQDTEAGRDPNRPMDGQMDGQGDSATNHRGTRPITAPAEEVIAMTDYESLHDGRMSGPLPEPQPSLTTRATAMGLPDDATRRSKAERRRDMYMNEVFYLRYCFAETQRAAYKFSGIGWPCMCGREFTRALSGREPLALLLLAFWGVLIGRESNSTWWTDSIGADLVSEISETLVLLERRGQLHEGFASLPEWKASVLWTRAQVGLTGIL